MDMYGVLASGEDCLEHCGGYVWGLSMWRRLFGALWWLCMGSKHVAKTAWSIVVAMYGVLESGEDCLEHCGGYIAGVS